MPSINKNEITGKNFVEKYFSAYSMIMQISIVSPIYRSRKSLEELTQRIISVMSSMNVDEYEIIYVDDNCPENSWEVIQEISIKNPKVRGIRLSRNFGQHFAISAGLAEAKGEKTIVMDCDLQEDPLHIKTMIQKSYEGAEIVFTRKLKREHSAFKNITAWMYQKLMNLLTPPGVKPYDPAIGTLSLMTSNVRKEFVKLTDTHRHYLMLLRWLGFRSETITISHEPRKYGKSSYSLKKLFNHSIDGLISQSTILLGLTAVLGLVILIICVLGSLWVFYMYFTRNLLPGWASIAIALSLSTGLIIFCLGLASLYIGKTFDQTRNRPLYIIAEYTKE